MQPSDILTEGRDYLCYVGMETDLIFNRGVDLPEFASFPLLESAKGRSLLRSYAEAQVDMARRFGVGVMLETPTWMANADRAAPLGYAADRIEAINADAVDLLNRVSSDAGDVPTVVSVNIGPRSDAYAPADRMQQAETARLYHLPQVRAAAEAGANVVSGFTIGYANEAAGIALAARESGIPAVISFTVETDGRLPGGETLHESITQVEEQTDGYPAYYMVNCAHPDHFAGALGDPAVVDRLAGVVANASRCSHAELDEAPELDDGNPVELGQQMGALAVRMPNLRVFGGCCGTDARHMSEIAARVTGARG